MRGCEGNEWEWMDMDAWMHHNEQTRERERERESRPSCIITMNAHVLCPKQLFYQHMLKPTTISLKEARYLIYISDSKFACHVPSLVPSSM